MIREKLHQELQDLGKAHALEPEFVRSIQELEAGDLAHFAESIDDSEYSLEEWLLALHEFHSWLRDRSATRPVRAQIDYLNCCVQGSVQGGGKLLPLAAVFREYVQLYGVEGV